MTTNNGATPNDWSLDGLRSFLTLSLGLRYDWDEDVTLFIEREHRVLRLVAALDAAHHVGLGLIAVFPTIHIRADQSVALNGEPIFAVMRGGFADGALVPLSSSAEEWIDENISSEDSAGSLSGRGVLSLFSRAGWVQRGSVHLPSGDLSDETRTISNVRELRHLSGQWATPETIAGNPHNSILCVNCDVPANSDQTHPN